MSNYENEFEEICFSSTPIGVLPLMATTNPELFLLNRFLIIYMKKFYPWFSPNIFIGYIT